MSVKQFIVLHPCTEFVGLPSPKIWLILVLDHGFKPPGDLSLRPFDL